MPLHPVTRQDGHPFAGPDPELGQSGGHLGDRPAVVGPRQGLPAERRATTHRRMLRDLFHVGAERGDDRRPFITTDGALST